MSFAAWLIAGSVFIIILALALGIGWWLRNNSHPTPAPPNKYTAPLGWGQPVAGPNPAKNFCQLYEFPTSTVTVGTGTVAIPGNPTFNPLILNSLQGTTGIPSCLDPDQILAQQLQHTCIAPVAVVDGAITRCFLITGGTTGLGGNENFYTNVGCPGIGPCPGQLSLISLNFNAPSAPIFCIQNEGAGNNVTMGTCAPSNTDQLFRVTRINPGQNPNALQSGQGQNGVIAQILDRNTGLCLVPGTGTAVTQYSPSSIGNSGCSGSGDSVSGTNVIMSTCTGGVFPGYVWALLPSVPYCSLIGGCGNCTGCAGCIPIPASNNCTGCQGCTDSHTLFTPPQIVYIGNLDFGSISTGMTSYNGLTGSSAVIQWLVDNNAQSLYFGGGNNTPVLTDIGIDGSYCPQKGYFAQYMNITTYNIISEEAVCFAEGTLGTPNCTGL